MFTNLGIAIYTKEKVNVFVNAKKGIIMTINMRRPEDRFCCRNIRGLGPVGYPCNVYSKSEEKETYEEAYFNYLDMHPELTEKDKEETFKKVEHNLNNSVLRALEDYDFVEVGMLGKYGNYVEAMLKPIEKKKGESKKQFLKREQEIRSKALRKAGINITYILEPGLFNKYTNILDNMKIEKEAKKYLYYARIERNNHVYGRKNKTLKLNKKGLASHRNMILALPKVG